MKIVFNKAIKCPYIKKYDKNLEKGVMLKAGIISSVCSLGEIYLVNEFCYDSSERSERGKYFCIYDLE